MENNRTKKREYETYRDNAGTIVKQVTNILAKCTMESPEEVTTLFDTELAITQAKVFLGREAQVIKIDLDVEHGLYLVLFTNRYSTD